MADNNDNNDNDGIDITLNCLIVPIGRQRVSALEEAIREQLEPPFDRLHLRVREIRQGTGNERPMDF
ncbi:hypothetical protein C1646_774573 [Rhizophagus diaphanus]|nr:hypothetical protein C1646_774573 [Rhizophagus diaphanus] [Rhizophagus sp. MUCL 43196]